LKVVYYIGEKKKRATLPRKTRLVFYLIFEHQIQKAVRSLDFHHKLFEVSKSRLKAIYFLDSVKKRLLGADNQ
jgi:hypothetical protein